MQFPTHFIKTCLLLWCVLCMPAKAWAVVDDPIVSREFFRDPSDQQTIETIGAQTFQPISGIFAGGYTGDTIWLRLVIRPAANGESLLLRILPSYLNQLTLFAPDRQTPGHWTAIENGNRLPWSERPHISIALGFPIQPEAETSYYLRLNTISNALLDVQALTPRQAAEQETWSLLWQGLYMALILWIILWAIQDYLFRREPVILVFALTYLSYLLYVIAILGYLPVILPASVPIPETTFALVTLAVLTSLLFHRSFLALFGINRASRWGFNALLAVSLSAVGLLIGGYPQLALKLNSLLTLLAAPCLLAMALSAQKQRLKIRIYYGLLCFSLVFYVIPILGLSKGSSWSLYGALIQGLLSATLFGHLLYLRSQEWAAEKTRTELQLTLAKHQIGMHKQQLQEQGQFTAMLTHEIKNPLSAIRFNLDSISGISDKQRGRIHLALTEINALADQCALADRIEQGHLDGTISRIDLNCLIDDSIAHRPERTRIVTAGVAAPLDCNAQALAIVLGNLIDNALKYSEADSRIDIALSPGTSAANAQGIQIYVKNRPGISGFPDPQQAFEKYHRGPNTSRQQGFGLGLYLVKTIADQQGWEIDYLPDDEQVIFRLWIPLSPRSAS